MKAILIDPMFETVQEVEYSGNYKDIYKLIGFQNVYMNDKKLMTGYTPRAFGVVRIPVGFDGIYVDDEGLYAELQFRWEYRYNRMHPPIQLVNKGLVLGCDDEGDSISPDSTVESIRRSITWEWTNEKKVKTA
jgi:hypothetical protein